MLIYININIYIYIYIYMYIYKLSGLNTYYDYLYIESSKIL